MQILHAHVDGTTVLLWGEAAGTRKLRRAPTHPFSLGVKDFAPALGLAVPKARQLKRLVWLPSLDGVPAPSTAALGRALAGGRPRIDPWAVEAVPLSVADLLTLGQFLEEGDGRLPGGMHPGPGLQYCVHLARFAASLVVRQQILPGVAPRQTGLRGCWEPLLLGADRERFDQFVQLMPPAVRAGAPDNIHEPAPNADALLRTLLGAMVDAVARPVVSPLDEERKARRRLAVHRRWVRDLAVAPGEFHEQPLERSFGDEIGRWRQPINAIATATHRLVVRLDEPAEDGDGPWLLHPLLQPVDDPSLLLPVESAWEKAGPVTHLRTHVVAELGNAASLCPPLARALKGRKPAPASLDAREAMAFLAGESAALDQAGIRTLLPAWWTRTGTKNRLAVRGTASRVSMQSASTSVMTLESMVRFDWKLAIGDTEITAGELESLAAAKAPLVRVRGHWVHVSAGEIQAAAAFWKKRGGAREMTLGEVMRLSLGVGAETETGGLELGEIDGTGEVGDFLQQFRDAGRLALLDPPKGLVATLRPYQVRGYSWLAFLLGRGLGACLADDMGLGKTIQTIAHILRDRQEGAKGPVLIVCPTSVLGNWVREIERFAPKLRAAIHHGLDRAKKSAEFTKSLRKVDVLVTSYSLLHRDIEVLGGVRWRTVVLDEAQNIKNPGTRQARAARALKADGRIALSGTPVENHVGELWSIMEFLNPGLLGSQAAFDRQFLKPIQRDGDEAAAGRLRRGTGPFVLRRLKSDRTIISDLPDKIENNVFCQLTREQGTLYAAALQDAEDRLNDADGIQRKGIVLSLLSRLKQICNHPAHFLGDHSAVGHRSGKLERLVEMIGEALEGGDRMLVFTQFAEMGQILQPHLQERFGREVLFLHGGVAKKQRDEMVRRFQEEEDGPPVFLLSLKAGGTGLNLTRATHVFHFDRWWNPAVEDQATDRAYRIGQRTNVQVHKFVCMGTVEERIDEMIRKKKELAGRVVGSGEGWITELSNNELRDLVALDPVAIIR